VVKPAVRRDAWKAARCNDGTPFAYTIRPGTEPTWVVNLSGGFFCEDDHAPCSDRRRRLTTTVGQRDGAVPRIVGEGVMSDDATVNPTFASAWRVDAHYCSSDLWLGSSTERQPTTGDPDTGWYFSGRENIRVLLDALHELHGLDDADPDTRMLVVGTSAGGAGVVGNLDQVVAAVPNAAAVGRVKVVLDGSWVPTQPPEVALPDADRWGPVQAGCDQDLRDKGEDPGRCVFGPIWWPYVQPLGIPILVQLSGLDKTQTPVFGVETPEQQVAWRAATRATLEPLPWVFSGGHAYHVVATDPAFARGEPGKAFRDVLDRFWAGGPPEQVFFRYDDEAARSGGTEGR
jgi:hypothetical protein